MRLRTDARLFEWSARVVLLAALLALLWLSRTASAEDRSGRAAQLQLGDALRRWTADPRTSRVAVELTEVPRALERDWLAGLRRSGVEVTWRGNLSVIAAEAVASAEPRPSYVIRAAGPSGGVVRIADGDREIVRFEPSWAGGSARTSTLAGPASVSVGRGFAYAAVPPSPRVGRVAAIGPASWETKYVLAALEESGWNVDARLPIAPDAVVGSLTPGALDTSRYSAVVVIDEAGGAWVPAIARFVNTGGGLVIAGRAGSAPELASLKPAAVSGALLRRDTLVVDRASLGGVTLVLANHAVPLEMRGEIPVVAAARVALGRVVLIGYHDTWRWRMLGDEDGPEQHRDWWSAIVGAVAYAQDSVPPPPSTEGAPLARTIGALGPPAAERHFASPRRPRAEALLFALAALALITETVSRRRRGEA